MYEYIKGQITAKQTDHLVLESNGIGYRIYTSLRTLNELVENQQDTVYTHLHVREDAMMLYGFSSKQELNIFLMLINISGIGPKVGLSLLSLFPPQTIALYIATDNVAELSKASGIGKKTAMRIILELKDKFKNIQVKDEHLQLVEDPITNDEEEAKTALMVLGYSQKQAQVAVNAVYQKEDTVESIIKKALNQINGG